MVPFIAARAAPIAPLGSPNASKLHSTRPRCWTHLPKQAVQVTAGFLQGRAFCRNARAESLCVIQSTCTRAGRGTYACEELVGSLNQEDPVASSGASVQQTHQNQSRLTVLLCLPPSATGHSQCRPQRNLNVLGSAVSSSFPFPQRSSLPFSRSRIRIAWRVAAVNVPFSMPCSRIVRQPYINERKRVDPRSRSVSEASVSIGEQLFSELSERIT